jgi:hypothetical protein
VDTVGLNLHPSTTAKALLATPELTVEKPLVDIQTCGNAGKKSHKALSVRFSGSKVAQHGSIDSSAGVRSRQNI